LLGPQCTTGSTGRRNTLSWRERWSVAMDQGFRRGFTTAEKTELWDRCDIGSARKNPVHIQYMTLSA
jgi:hypothetical protein